MKAEVSYMNLEAFLEIMQDREFNVLSIITPYANFSMENLKDNDWSSETGRIAVVTHQDLSEPVSRLIAETSRYSVDQEQLRVILAQGVYRW